jgi:hypothetical protein
MLSEKQIEPTNFFEFSVTYPSDAALMQTDAQSLSISVGGISLSKTAIAEPAAMNRS